MNKKVLALVLVAGLLICLLIFLSARKESGIRPKEKISIPEIKNDEKKLSYDEIKILIGSGKMTQVPSYINQSKRIIELEYLKDCYDNEDFELKSKCYEGYFIGRDNSLREQKEACNSLTGLDKTTCLDQYYHKMGMEQNKIFCEKIEGKELSEDCSNRSE